MARKAAVAAITAGCILAGGNELEKLIDSEAGKLNAQTVGAPSINPSMDIGMRFNNDLLSTNSNKFVHEYDMMIRNFYRLYPKSFEWMYNILKFDQFKFNLRSDLKSFYGYSGGQLMLLPMLDPNTFVKTKFTVQHGSVDTTGISGEGKGKGGNSMTSAWFNQVMDMFYYLNSRSSDIRFVDGLLGASRLLLGRTELTINPIWTSSEGSTDISKREINNFGPSNSFYVDTTGNSSESSAMNQLDFSVRQNMFQNALNIVDSAYVSFSRKGASFGNHFSSDTSSSWFFITPNGSDITTSRSNSIESRMDNLSFSLDTLPLPGLMDSMLKLDYSMIGMENGSDSGFIKRETSILGFSTNTREMWHERRDFSISRANADFTSDSFVQQLKYSYMFGRIKNGNGTFTNSMLDVPGWNTKYSHKLSFNGASANLRFGNIGISLAGFLIEETSSRDVINGTGANTNMTVPILNSFFVGQTDPFCDRTGNISRKTNNVRSLELAIALLSTRDNGITIGEYRNIEMQNKMDELMNSLCMAPAIFDMPSSSSIGSGIAGINLKYQSIKSYEKSIFSVSALDDDVYGVTLWFNPLENLGIVAGMDNFSKSKLNIYSASLSYWFGKFKTDMFNRGLMTLSYSLMTQPGQENISSLSAGMTVSFGGLPRMIDGKRLSYDQEFQDIRQLTQLTNSADLDTIVNEWGNTCISRLKSIELGNEFRMSGNQNNARMHSHNLLDFCRKVNSELVDYSIAVKDMSVRKTETDDPEKAFGIVKTNMSYLNENYFHRIGKHVVFNRYTHQDLGDFPFIEIADIVNVVDGRKLNLENAIILANHSLRNNLPFEAYSDGHNIVFMLNKIEDNVNEMRQRVAGLPKGYIRQIAAGKSYNAQLSESEIYAIRTMFLKLAYDRNMLNANAYIKNVYVHERKHDQTPNETEAYIEGITKGNGYLTLYALLGQNNNIIDDYEMAFDDIYCTIAEYGKNHGIEYGFNARQNIWGQIPLLLSKNPKRISEFFEKALTPKKVTAFNTTVTNNSSIDDVVKETKTNAAPVYIPAIATNTKQSAATNKKPAAATNVKPEFIEARQPSFVNEEKFYSKNMLLFENFEENNIIKKFMTESGNFDVYHDASKTNNSYGRWSISSNSGPSELKTSIRLPDMSKFTGFRLSLRSAEIGMLDFVVVENTRAGERYWHVPVSGINSDWMEIEIPCRYLRLEGHPEAKLDLARITDFKFVENRKKQGSIDLDNIVFYK